MEVKVKVELTGLEPLVAALKALGTGCTCKSSPGVDAAPETTMPEREVVKKKEVKPDKTKVQESEAEKVTPPEPAPEVDEEENALTLDDVRAAIAKKNKPALRAQLKAVLGSHGAEKVSQIAEKDYAAVIAAVEAL